MHRSHLYFLDDIKEAAEKILNYSKGMSYEQFLPNTVPRTP